MYKHHRDVDILSTQHNIRIHLIINNYRNYIVLPKDLKKIKNKIIIIINKITCRSKCYSKLTLLGTIKE